MNPDEGDQRIRAALAEAHRSDGARMPSFKQMWTAAKQTARSRSSARVWLLTSASLTAAIGLAAWLIAQLGPPAAEFPRGTHWTGPTDFLLRTPGLVTLRTVPEFGSTSSSPLLHPPVDARRGTP